MTVSQRLQHQLKERRVGQCIRTVMTDETTWTKDTHRKFGLLSYSVYTFIRHKGETKREIEQIGTRQNLQ